MIMKRRQILGAALLMPLQSLAQTCGALTRAQTEGPFFKTHTPLRRIFLEKDAKSRFLLTGIVLERNCRPVPNALLEFWHADEEGEYDNRGYRCRGHQHADARGRYRLQTIVQALYPGRARHFHVKVQAPGGRVLTTQLYFPGDEGNRLDFLYRPELAMKAAKPGEGSFDFVVEA